VTPRQLEYIQHRAAGIQPTAAARAAGYAAKSAKVSACRMEADPAIAAAIEAARQGQQADEPCNDTPLQIAQHQIEQHQQGQQQDGAGPAYDAEGYLQAVVAGAVPPDPVRVSAARTLIAYEKARQRAPVKSPPPRQLAAQDKVATERELLDAWAEKAAEVRARMGRT
jgi:hypothetical protein